MRAAPDETHDANLHSWLESAEDAASDFPIQNLPLGVFRTEPEEPGRIGAAIGDRILDLRACNRESLLRGLPLEVEQACHQTTLNAYMALPSRLRRALRHRLSHLLRASGAQVTAQPSASRVLVKQSDAELLLPASIGDYTDFYASVFHATNVGVLFRPDNPLLPNYKWVPIGYHGRASSIVVSGTPVKRPWGQTEGAAEAPPSFGPTRSLDYELEVGFFMGPGNVLGLPIPIGEAEQHVVGLCLLNDWSARDVQKWEYQPLGPFLAKSFATSISPWVVTLEALAPFRAPAFARPAGDPQPLPYLSDGNDLQAGGIDVATEVWLRTARMRETGAAPVRLSRSNLRDLYWTPAQMLTHHASNGCNLRPGDLFASGTVSGPTPEARGCLLELTTRGRDPVVLPDGETRRFLEDGDEINLRAGCEREGFRRIGFGECRGVVTPAEKP
jgi:fumarylacetoacetase